MNTKENIINRLRETNRENIEKVIDYMEENRFFEVGCHRHHRYDGGLADHAWQTYQIAMKEEADNKRQHPDIPCSTRTVWPSALCFMISAIVMVCVISKDMEDVQP